MRTKQKIKSTLTLLELIIYGLYCGQQRAVCVLYLCSCRLKHQAAGTKAGVPVFLFPSMPKWQGPQSGRVLYDTVISFNYSTSYENTCKAVAWTQQNALRLEPQTQKL